MDCPKPRKNWTGKVQLFDAQMGYGCMVDSPLYNCGQIQTIRHIVEECPEIKFSEGTSGLHNGEKEALDSARLAV